MLSHSGWGDFFEQGRQQMLDVIQQFRDPFAGHLFPGTSTIQTRTRYFLYIPWT